MAHTRQTQHKYKTKEQEEMARKKMEEEAKKSGKRKYEEKELEEGEIADTEDSQVETQESQEGDGQETEEGKDEPPKKKEKYKHDKPKGIKSMSKEERKSKAEERKALRKENAWEKKKAKEEADKEKARLKREEHKVLLERTCALLNRNTPSAAAGSAMGTATVEIHPGPSKERQAVDILETSLVESGGPLNLNPFPSEEEEENKPNECACYMKSTVETDSLPSYHRSLCPCSSSRCPHYCIRSKSCQESSKEGPQ